MARTLRRLRRVFPAHAGVILLRLCFERAFRGLPRACGGDPLESEIFILHGLSSPRMRG